MNEAKLKFQAVSLAYEILSNEETRREYDETGEIYDDGEFQPSSTDGKDGVQQWMDVFDKMFGRVSTRDIEKFEIKYKGSDEEKQDVLKYYEACKGNLNKMLTCVMLSEDEDKQRWVKDYIEPAITSGLVERYDALAKTSSKSQPVSSEDDGSDCDSSIEKESSTNKSSRKNKKKSNKKKKESNKPTIKKKNQKVKNKQKNKKTEEVASNDLIAMIRGNAAARGGKSSFNDLLSSMEDRYSSSSSSKKRSNKTKQPDDIPDDEFDKIRARLEDNKKKASKAKSRKK